MTARAEAIAAEPAASPRSAVRCRAIAGRDLDAVARLLARGFPERPAAYWRRGLARQADLAPAGEAPRYGYLLAHGDAVVGVLLTLYAEGGPEGRRTVRCNLSSWYVEPEFRGYGVMLDTFAMRDRRTTYLNISPAPHTVAMHEARGFVPFSHGQSLIVPALSRRRPGQTVRRWTERDAELLPPHEAEMVRHHVGYGCIALLCTDAAGTRPIVLLRRRLKLSERQGPNAGLPCVQLIYGPTGADLAHWAGTVGRHLLRHHAMPWILLDADGPCPGVVGRYFDGRKSKYVRGPHRPPLGDLTYTELVIFGP